MTVTASQHPSITDDATATDEWQVGQLDVDAYLARIDYDGPLDPTVDTLFALHRAHALTIPFENFDIILGRGVSLDLDTLQDKMLRHHRGGYCFEHNLLFAALLERAGFAVRRHLGRVLSADPNHHQPRTHMTINVDAGGTTWHADVGFGTALSEPIPLEDGVEVTQGGWMHGLTRREDGTWALRSLGPEGWSERYVYAQDRQYLVDYVAANHYTSTYPGSHFTQTPVAVRLTPDARYRLNGLELSIATPDGSDERRAIAPEEVSAVLHDRIGIALERDDVEQLIAKLAPDSN